MFQFLAITQAGCRRSFPRYLLHRIATLTFIAVVGLLTQTLCFPEANADSVARPNIVLIMADDIGYECFGCYGSEQYQTPHIDRLASRGMRFEHCYSQPLCTPSRVKLMTGLSNIRNYSAFSVLNSDQKTIGHYFQETGYDTFIGGKWQLLGAEHYPEQFRLKGSWPTETGFDHCCLWQVDKLGDRYWNPLLFLDGNNKQFPPNDYGPDIVTDHILDFIQEERESPFFVYYPMILVHNPFLTTPDSETKSRETKSRETKNRKNQQQNFEDMVAYMDHLVGRIVEQIEKQGIAEETVILFTGDNGTNKAITSQLNGRTIVGGKGKTTDAGTRVALVATHSGSIPEGKVCEDLVDFSDFLPTLMDYAGLPIPDGLDGVSFAPQLKGDPGRPREWIFCYYNPRPERTKPVRFVRDQRWKLYGDGKFFDVSNDPLEEHPVDERPDAYRKLKQALDTMPSESTTLLKFAQ